MDNTPDIKKMSLKTLAVVVVVIIVVIFAGVFLSPKTTTLTNPDHSVSQPDSSSSTPSSTPTTDPYGAIK
jgi:hypothetical protein